MAFYFSFDLKKKNLNNFRLSSNNFLVAYMGVQIMLSQMKQNSNSIKNLRDCSYQLVLARLLLFSSLGVIIS